MKKSIFLLIFLASIFSIPIVESKDINCNSPVWKNKPACKGRKSSKITYIYNGKKFDSLSSIANSYPYSDIYSRGIMSYKNKRYVSSRSCPSGTSMFFYIQPRLLRSTSVQEWGCLTPQEQEIAQMRIQMQNMRRQIRANALNNLSNSINNLNQQQQINTNTYNSNFGY